MLRLLHGVSVPLNASQVAAQTRLSQPAAATALRDLERMGIVAGSSARTRVYWLVRDNVYARTIVDAVFSAEHAVPDLLLADLVDAFGAFAVSVVLFGSYARGEQDDASDIDVVVVAADDAARAVLDSIVDMESPRLSRVWGAPLSPLVYGLEEAAALHTSAPELWAQIGRDGVVACGKAPREWVRHGDTT